MTELLHLGWLTAEDLFAIRRRGREVAAALGLDENDQIRVATALSEVGRELFGTGPASVVFEALRQPDRLVVVVGSALTVAEPSASAVTGVSAARRLVDSVEIERDAGRTVVRLEKRVSLAATTDADLSALRESLDHVATASAVDELRAQNAELVRVLDEVTRDEQELSRVNAELTETNRGVLALYNQLSGELEETNRGVVALYAELDARGEQLAQANEAKTRFLRNVSHELRAPVSAIVGLTGLLVQGPLDEEQQRQVGYVRSSAQSLLDLVNELLDLARAESNRLEVSLGVVDLEWLFDQLRTAFEPIAAARRVALAVEPPGVRLVRTDGELLTRVLRNLLSNALSFTEEGEVRLSSGADLDRARLSISVADTGIGIAEEHQGLIFEEFFQVPGPLQTTRSGTGLGLPYVRYVVEALGGTLGLDSELGRGSRFTVALPLGVHEEAAPRREEAAPLGASPPAAAPTAAPAAAPAAAVSKLVLVVDDDEAFRHVVASLVAAAGSEVLEAADGEAALRLARERRPDLMLLDVRMPGLDGTGVIARLRTDLDEKLRELPVVLMTNADIDPEIRRIAGPARAVLAKSEVGQRVIDQVLATVRASELGEGTR